MHRLLALALGLALLPAAAPAAGRVVLLHTNDLHGQLYPTDPPEDLGGAARRATLVRRERAAAAAAGDGVLLLDAGDVNTGTFLSDRSRGLLDVKTMNLLGYDGVAVGNHEFDLIGEDLLRFREAARFPLLSANIRDRKYRRVFRPWVIHERAGRRVAVVGLTTPGVPRTSTFGSRYPYRYRDPVDELARALDQVDAEGVDAVVVLTHLGDLDDQRTMDAFPGRFAAWIGGHTHVAEVQELPGRALYVRAGSKGRWLGRIVLAWEGGRPVVEHHERIAVDASIPPDPEMAGILPPRASGPPIATATGALTKSLTRGGRASSTLGNLFTDALRSQGEVDVAVMNRGGLRRDLPAGPLRAHQLYGVCPFRNMFYRYTLTGAQVRAVFGESARMGASGPGFLEVSGAEVRVTGNRVRVTVGGEPLRDGRRYTLGVSDFLANGGDGYTIFKTFPPPEVLTATPAEMLQAHAAGLGTLVPDPSPRMLVEPSPGS